MRSAARGMRGHAIDVEQAMWWRLRGRKFGGLKFRRQHPIGRLIADFACLEAKLIVELDGKQHEGSLADELRTAELSQLGFQVIRSRNERVRVDIDWACEEILGVAQLRMETPHPSATRTPSPTRGEG